MIETIPPVSTNVGTTAREYFNNGVPNGAPWTFSQAGTYARYSITKPDRRAKPSGWLFPTPYKFDKEVTHYPKGKAEVFGPNKFRRYIGGVQTFVAPVLTGHNVLPNIDYVSQAEAKALNQFLTHGKARDGTFNAGLAWAERKETARMLESFAQTSVDVLRALKSGQWKKVFNYLGPMSIPDTRRELSKTAYWKWLKGNQRWIRNATPKELASGYLTYMNGLKPLLGDIHNAAEALANRNSPEHWVITAIAKVQHHTRNIEQMRVVTGDGNKYPLCNREVVYTKGAKVRLDARVTDALLHRLAQLGLNNPAHTTYEATRLSYILDYVLGVGNWLQSLGAVDGMTFYSGSFTTYAEVIVQVSEAETSEHNKFSGVSTRKLWERKVYTSFPVPIPPLSLKPEPLNLWQKANALSVFFLMVTGNKVPNARSG